MADEGKTLLFDNMVLNPKENEGFLDHAFKLSFYALYLV